MRSRLRKVVGLDGDSPLLPLVVLAGLNFVDELDRIAFAALTPEIRQAFGLSDTGIGAIGALSGVLILLAALPVGIVADRFSRVRLATAAAVVWGTMSVLTGVVPSVALLFVVRVSSGIGRVLSEVVHASLLTDTYAPRLHARVFRVHRLANPLSALSAVAAGTIAATLGWQWAFFLLSVPTFLLLAGMRKVREPVRGETTNAELSARAAAETPVPFRESRRQLTAVRSLRRMWLFAFFLGIGGLSIPQYLALFYEQVYGFGPVGRGFVQFLYGVGIVAGILVGGRYAHRVLEEGRPARLATVTGMSFVVFGLAAFATVMSPWMTLSLLFTVVMSGGFGAAQPAYYPLVGQVAPPRLRAQAYAFAIVYTGLGGFLSVVIFGIGEADGWRLALGVVGAVVVGAGFIGASASRFVPHDVEQARYRFVTSFRPLPPLRERIRRFPALAWSTAAWALSPLPGGPDPSRARPAASALHTWHVDPEVRRGIGRVVAIVLVPLAAVYTFGEASPPPGILLNGAVIGSLYALVAVGIVLVFKANRVVSFAQAGLGAAPAVVALLLYTRIEVPYALAVLTLVAGAAALGALVEVLVVRRFSRSPRLILTVATIGIAQVLLFVELYTPQWMTGNIQVPTDFRTPFTAIHFSLGGVNFTGDHVLAVVAVGALTSGLAVFLARTRVGIGVRAAAENAPRAATLAVPVAGLSTVVWVIAALLSAVGVFLRAPIVGLPAGSSSTTTVLLFALGAAAVGKLQSFPVTFAAGIALGIVDQAVFFGSGNGALSVAVVLPIVLFALLTQRPDESRVDEASSWQMVADIRRVPEALRRVPEVRVARAAALGIVGLVLVGMPFIVGPLRRDTASLILVQTLIGLSMVVLTGWAGQLSLGQLAFAGVGGVVTARLVTGAGLDFVLAMVIGGLVGAAAAVVVGIPALRLRGMFLAVTTLTFAAAAQAFVFDRRYFGWLVPDPSVALGRPLLYGRVDTGSDLTYYYVCLIVVGAASASLMSIRKSRTGRLLIAARDNARGIEVYGVDVARTRLTAFAMSGFLAATAGTLYVFLVGTFDPRAFTASASIEAFATAVIGGLSSVAGPLLGAAYVVGFGRLFPQYALLATGAGMLVLLLFFPGGLAELVDRARLGFLRWVAQRRGLVVDELQGVEPIETDVSPLDEQSEADAGLLSCDGLEVAYGNVQILFGVDFEVRRGEVVALLGTNGAGKSTLLRAISGLVDPFGGRIRFEGEDVTHHTPAEMASLGVAEVPGGRGVFPSLTVRENLVVASWGASRDPEALTPAVADALDRFPALRRHLDDPAGAMSGGEQQMLALAMAFLSSPELLLIDELSLGLAPTVVEDLLSVVRAINRRGTTVVIVEQSLTTAMRIADRAYFMERGRVRFEGATSDLARRHDIVRSVFLSPGASDAVHDGRRDVRAGTDVVLSVRGVTKSFGGIRALDAVDLDVLDGQILGLIGANGAGKTTLFDTVSGFIRPDAGRIMLGDDDVTDAAPPQRAMGALGRSFQDARLFPSLTVAQCLAVSVERHLPFRDHVASALALPAARELEDDIAWSVADLLELTGLGSYRNRFIRELSTGTRRIVDLGMVLAHRPRLLLLDEPSAGIAQRETEALVPLLTRIRGDVGCAILVIDHDMPLVTAVSDEIAAMDQGSVVARGSAAEVLSDARVVEAYLGTSPRPRSRRSQRKATAR